MLYEANFKNLAVALGNLANTPVLQQALKSVYTMFKAVTANQ